MQGMFAPGRKAGQLVSFEHFCCMLSPLRGQMIGFLDDLFVVSDHRSGGSAAALIKAMQKEAKAKLWITRDHNIGPAACMKLAEKPIGCSMI